MADETHAIEWWPEFLAEEVMPPGRSRPEEWITRVDETYVLGAQSEDRDDWDAPGHPIASGAVLDFWWYQPLGRRRVAFKGDGTFTVLQSSDLFAGGAPSPEAEQAPDGYTQCHIYGEAERGGDNLADLAACEAGALDPDEVTVEIVCFGLDGDARFIFEVDAASDAFALSPVATGGEA